MHAHHRTPRHGNWIWLAAAGVSIAAFTAAALAYGRSPGCRARATGTAAAATTWGPTSSAAAATPADAQTAAGPAHSGLALYYDPGTALGSCMLGPFPQNGLYVSLPIEQYGHGAACGSYLDVRGPRGVVRAEVVDLCTGCSASTINLSEAAFSRIADPRPGSAHVTYREAANPRLSGPIVVRVLSASAPGSVALQILDHGNRLSSVSIAQAATDTLASATNTAPALLWRQLSLGSNGLWLADIRSIGPGPFQLRITDDRGHHVMLRRLALRPDTTVHRHRWMYPRSASLAAADTASSLPPASAAISMPPASHRPARPRLSGARPSAAGGCQ